jgi:hypothetical protein
MMTLGLKDLDGVLERGDPDMAGRRGRNLGSWWQPV